MADFAAFDDVEIEVLNLNPGYKVTVWPYNKDTQVRDVSKAFVTQASTDINVWLDGTSVSQKVAEVLTVYLAQLNP